jgi:hypothetical protein
MFDCNKYAMEMAGTCLILAVLLTALFGDVAVRDDPDVYWRSDGVVNVVLPWLHSAMTNQSSAGLQDELAASKQAWRDVASVSAFSTHISVLAATCLCFAMSQGAHHWSQVDGYVKWR